MGCIKYACFCLVWKQILCQFSITDGNEMQYTGCKLKWSHRSIETRTNMLLMKDDNNLKYLQKTGHQNVIFQINRIQGWHSWSPQKFNETETRWIIYLIVEMI